MRLLMTCVALFCTFAITAQTTELGTVKWLRDYDKAIELANKNDKPIFILFQEVPGCATCRNYGSNVLSDPLLVDAIENYFVPLAIFNNKGGQDKKILEKYNEPTWNNPVVRIVDNNGKPIQKRLASNYSNDGLINYMIESFPKSNREVPAFLIALQDFYSVDQYKVQVADFSMYCFWTGEGHLGNVNGVVATEPGFKNGKEVVRVNYDPSIINQKQLASHAKKAKCSIMKEDGRFRSDKDPQYYLKQTKYKYLALSPFQRTKINSLIAQRADPSIVLSPSQFEYYSLIEDHKIKNPKVLYTEDIKESWGEMTAQLDN